MWLLSLIFPALVASEGPLLDLFRRLDESGDHGVSAQEFLAGARKPEFITDLLAALECDVAPQPSAESLPAPNNRRKENRLKRMTNGLERKGQLDTNVLNMTQYIEYGEKQILTGYSTRYPSSTKTERKIGLREEFHFLLAHLGDGGQVIQKLLDEYKFQTVADIGAGVGWHSKIFKDHGKTVVGIELGKTHALQGGKTDGKGTESQIVGNFMCGKLDRTFDVVWANHVLEHIQNPGLFMKRLFDMLPEGGILALSVPPFKTDTVGGHVSNWHAGLLIQHLVRSGFNCKHLRFLRHGYNLSLLLKKVSITEKINWIHDNGDIKLMKPYLPDVLVETNNDLKKDSFNGNIVALNW